MPCPEHACASPAAGNRRCPAHPCGGSQLQQSSGCSAAAPPSSLQGLRSWPPAVTGASNFPTREPEPDRCLHHIGRRLSAAVPRPETRPSASVSSGLPKPCGRSQRAALARNSGRVPPINPMTHHIPPSSQAEAAAQGAGSPAGQAKPQPRRSESRQYGNACGATSTGQSRPSSSSRAPSGSRRCQRRQRRRSTAVRHPADMPIRAHRAPPSAGLCLFGRRRPGLGQFG